MVSEHLMILALDQHDTTYKYLHDQVHCFHSVIYGSCFLFVTVLLVPSDRKHKSKDKDI